MDENEELTDIDDLELPDLADEVEDKLPHEGAPCCTDCGGRLVETDVGHSFKWWRCLKCKNWYPAAHIAKHSRCKGVNE